MLVIYLNIYCQAQTTLSATHLVQVYRSRIILIFNMGTDTFNGGYVRGIFVQVYQDIIRNAACAR